MTPRPSDRPRFPFSATLEAISLGLSAIRAYKLRAGLTILGVVMGIMTVTGMSSIVAGLNASMAKQIEGFGSAVVFVRPFGPGEHPSAEERRKRKGLNEREVQALMERCRSCAGIAPLELPRVDLVKYGREKVQTSQMIGTTPAYEFVHDTYAEKGRFLSNTDVNRGAKVAVIGAEIAETLFPHVDPIDKEMSMDGVPFRVIGVLERKGKFLNFNRDNMILIPLGALQKRDAFFNFMVADIKAQNPALMDRTMDEVRDILRRERKLKYLAKDTFAMFSQETLSNLYTQLTSGIYLVMIAISSIGLVVGGVGVMNIMLVSVTERTREIGVRKALGARRRDIRWQFLTEAMTLTGAGGVLGILVGALVALAVNALSPFPAVVQPTWVMVAFVTSLIVGLSFGMWPAEKAARLDPIEALRYE
ncbi:MAG TPA: ABC transporter permease [Vicinamibacteria bacterium]|nr:ABC transporter permease [Vicinamibacteria bacterium]